MAVYKQEDKTKIISRFQQQCTRRRAALVKDMTRLLSIFEAKVQRRITSVPKKFTGLCIRDVLTVERDHKIKIYELLKDVGKLHTESSHGIRDDEIRQELAKVRQKRAEGVKLLQKRKESMQGRVRKPTKEANEAKYRR